MDSETELELLFKVLTIHVSHFFRNPLTFKKLEKDVIPEIITQCKNNNRSELRLWSVGCASGEEPYSLAIILKEAFKAQVEGLDLSIQATDVDTDTLQLAKAGIYTEDRLRRGIFAVKSPILRAKWFKISPAAGNKRDG